jgi:uncharacterized membrane protein
MTQPPTPPPPPGVNDPGTYDGAPPPPPPSAPPPPPSGLPADNSNRTIMIVLGYLWILALIPLLVEQDDPEVQWHAKHGLVLFVAEIILYAVLAVLGQIPIVGCIAWFLPAVVFLAFLVVRVLAITKGVNGQRFLIPGVSDFANKF